jgi:hypothetical protein
MGPPRPRQVASSAAVSRAMAELHCTTLLVNAADIRLGKTSQIMDANLPLNLNFSPGRCAFG